MALGEVATVERNAIDPAQISEGTIYVGLENISQGGRFCGAAPLANGDVTSTKFLFDERHVLFGKLRPYLAKIARPDFSGVCSTDILPIAPGPRLDADYLRRFLSYPPIIADATRRSTGANLPRLSPKELERFTVPLPPLDEQRRITRVLDAADALSTKRREASRLVSALQASAFAKAFSAIPRNNETTLGSVLAEPLGNGMSPSKVGQVPGEVLTLSALTESGLDPTARKPCLFAKPPAERQFVRPGQFLICRGNGNLNLVGRGAFVDQDLPGVAYPDTMIAAKIRTDMVTPEFLERVWSSPTVRSQLQRGARTTSGIHKVNQSLLAQIRFAYPAYDVQVEFSRHSKLVKRLAKEAQAHLHHLDALFASLQHRAFAGEL